MSRTEDSSQERSKSHHAARSEAPSLPELDPAGVLEELPEKAQLVTNEVAKVVVGQTAAVGAVLYALLSRGHCLFVGVPGLAKTLLVRSTARVRNLPDCH